MSEAEFEALEEQKRKNQAAIDLIQSWMEEGSDGDEDTWPQIEQFLREHPLTTRGPLHEEAA